MKVFVAVLALFVACSEAKPSRIHQIGSTTHYQNVDSQIIGGQDVNYGQFPWQLSQQRNGGHSCGASLLNSRYALSAAHCVDGADPNSMRVVAGLHARSNEAGTQSSIVQTYKMHEQYNTGGPTYANDIAILTFQTLINIGGNIQPANLPGDNGNSFAGQTCIITGWGRNSNTNNLPDVMQMAEIGVISSGDCNNWVGGIWDGHICVYDSANYRGACNGDSGGPINCPGGPIAYLMTGVASFVFQSGGNCLPNYPSVYTRVSYYLGWIYANTP